MVLGKDGMGSVSRESLRALAAIDVPPPNLPFPFAASDTSHTTNPPDLTIETDGIHYHCRQVYDHFTEGSCVVRQIAAR
jgi:hypothetical protein